MCVREEGSKERVWEEHSVGVEECGKVWEEHSVGVEDIWGWS